MYLLTLWLPEYFINGVLILVRNLEIVTRSKFPFPNGMSNTDSSQGVCPLCGSTIPAGAILIKYEVESETRLFAECYECEQPVRPQ